MFRTYLLLWFEKNPLKSEILVFTIRDFIETIKFEVEIHVILTSRLRAFSLHRNAGIPCKSHPNSIAKSDQRKFSQETTAIVRQITRESTLTCGMPQVTR